jgi:tripartite-type tricarboxylate transporter receptor subunit TctC
MALSPFILPQLPSAFAQAKFPGKPIQLLVGFPPGQASDIGARLFAKQMTETLKQTVYVENKPGAATIIAHRALKAAPADGYTIAYSSTGPLAINPTLYKKLP